MKQKSFTMAEVLIAMAIIGTLAFLTANGLKSIDANEAKLGFKNCYKVMVETYNKIVTDETILPNEEFGTDTETGHPTRTPLCSVSDGTKCGTQLFVDAFMDNIKYIDKTSVGSSVQAGYGFEAKNGSYWQVQGNPDSMSCYTSATKTEQGSVYITFDVNGLGKGTNCPYTNDTSNSSKIFSKKVTSCSDPDTFRFYVTPRYTLEPDSNAYYNGLDLETYMKKNKLISVEESVED